MWKNQFIFRTDIKDLSLFLIGKITIMDRLIPCRRYPTSLTCGYYPETSTVVRITRHHLEYRRCHPGWRWFLYWRKEIGYLCERVKITCIILESYLPSPFSKHDESFEVYISMTIWIINWKIFCVAGCLVRRNHKTRMSTIIHLRARGILTGVLCSHSIIWPRKISLWFVRRSQCFHGMQQNIKFHVNWLCKSGIMTHFVQMTF